MSTNKPLEAATTLELVKHFRLQWEEVPQAWMLLYPEGRVQLNSSAGEIIKRVDGKRTIGEITAELQATFNAPDLRDDILEALEIACKQGWLKVSDHAA
jgi:pyrroloquinoline quinone biosynthesis protein D